jgi:hypothetical protein
MGIKYKDRSDIRTGKVGYSGNQKSVKNTFDHGPVFGGGWDLYCNKNGYWYGSPSSYPEIGIRSKFYVDDYEVFQVIKK